MLNLTDTGTGVSSTEKTMTACKTDEGDRPPITNISLDNSIENKNRSREFLHGFKDPSLMTSNAKFTATGLKANNANNSSLIQNQAARAIL